jgi:acetylornithine/N-succinyldiaminopimelate aminotransferase
MTISTKLLPIHKRLDICFSHGEGPYLFAEDKKYLDFGAGVAVNVFGHCNSRLVEALTKQAKKLWHVSNIYEIKELENFATKLVKASKFADHVFFCNSGAEAIECGIKMVRKHFYDKGETSRNRIITFTGAFHGRTIATISAAAKKKYLEGFTPALEGFDNVEFGNIEAVKNAITKDTAAILIEPIQGEEGIRASSREFIKELRKLADQKGLLLV